MSEELKPEQVLQLMKGWLINARGAIWLLNGDVMPFNLANLTRLSNLARATPPSPSTAPVKLPPGARVNSNLVLNEEAPSTTCADGGNCGAGGYCARCPHTSPSTETLREALTLIKHSRDFHRLMPSSQKIINDALVAPGTASEAMSVALSEVTAKLDRFAAENTSLRIENDELRAALASKPNDRIMTLLREARATLEMWKDVAPAVSLCADIDAAIAATQTKE